MSASDLTEYVQQLRLDEDPLADARVREVVGKVLNLVEAVGCREPPPTGENQHLREIIRQLKGESTPAARPSRRRHGISRPRKTAATHAPVAWFPRADRRSFRDIRVDEEIICPSIRRVCLDAKFVGYEDVVVQDLRIQSHNIRYRLEIWDSPSQGQCAANCRQG